MLRLEQNVLTDRLEMVGFKGSRIFPNENMSLITMKLYVGTNIDLFNFIRFSSRNRNINLKVTHMCLELLMQTHEIQVSSSSCKFRIHHTLWPMKKKHSLCFLTFEVMSIMLYALFNSETECLAAFCFFPLLFYFSFNY